MFAPSSVCTQGTWRPKLFIDIIFKRGEAKPYIGLYVLRQLIEIDTIKYQNSKMRDFTNNITNSRFSKEDIHDSPPEGVYIHGKIPF
jgi:hypothetical protein